jgi:hypothetical protein
MTCFEHYFAAMKKALDKDDLYEIWPDFCPQYDEYEYAWTSIRGLGEALLLNCGPCEGPSDLRHIQCKSCVEKRGSVAKGAFQKATGQQKDNWSTIILCRIHQR